MLWVWCEIVCDTCSATVSGRMISAQHIPRRDMKEEAIRQGWHFVRAQDSSNEDAFCSQRCKDLSNGN